MDSAALRSIETRNRSTLRTGTTRTPTRTTPVVDAKQNRTNPGMLHGKWLSTPEIFRWKGRNIKMTRTYISGPISGRPNGNQEAFSRAAEHLLKCGYIPVNPHDVCYLLPPGSSWAEYMRTNIPALCRCQEIYMLKGWWKSRGARVEWVIARVLGMKVFYA